MTMRIGSHVGNYEVLELVGEGGMGQVYRARDTMLQRDVAIKALHPHLTSDAALVERFRAEAVTLARLQHPNITALYTMMREGDDFLMVMEFVAGENLDSHLKISGAMPPARVACLFRQVLEAFEYAHGKGVIHRDIKPANIMVCDGDEVKIMDFGIARVVGSQRLTMAGRLVGTPAYMSPEQILGSDVDARSDIYSLGIVLYQMLTGVVPFSRTSDFELLRSQVEDAPPALGVLGCQVPNSVERVIMRALAKSPADRFQTAGEFKAALTLAMVEAYSGSVAQTAIVSSNAGLTESSRASKAVVWAFAGGAVLVAAAVGGWFFLGSQPAARQPGSAQQQAPAPAQPPVSPVTAPPAQGAVAGEAGTSPGKPDKPVVVQRPKAAQDRTGLTEEQRREQEEARKALRGEEGSTLQDRLGEKKQ